MLGSLFPRSQSCKARKASLGYSKALDSAPGTASATANLVIEANSGSALEAHGMPWPQPVTRNAYCARRRILSKIGPPNPARTPASFVFPIPPIRDDFTTLVKRNLLRLIDKEAGRHINTPDAVVSPRPGTDHHDSTRDLAVSEHSEKSYEGHSEAGRHVLDSTVTSGVYTPQNDASGRGRGAAPRISFHPSRPQAQEPVPNTPTPNPYQEIQPREHLTLHDDLDNVLSAFREYDDERGPFQDTSTGAVGEVGRGSTDIALSRYTSQRAGRHGHGTPKKISGRRFRNYSTLHEISGDPSIVPSFLKKHPAQEVHGKKVAMGKVAVLSAPEWNLG